MKRKDLANLRESSLSELTKQVDKAREDLVKEKAEFKAGKNTNPKKIRTLKKNIAQLLTLVEEKKIFEKKQVGEGKEK